MCEQFDRLTEIFELFGITHKQFDKNYISDFGSYKDEIRWLIAEMNEQGYDDE